MEVIDVTVVKVIEIIGESDVGWEDAAKVGFKRACETIENVTGIEVTAMTAKASKGELVQYRATLKVAFFLNDR